MADMLFRYDDVLWLAQNAKRQHSGEISVAWMAKALEWYFDEGIWRTKPTVRQIANLGRMVEPHTNHTSRVFRNYRIRIGIDDGAPWRKIDSILSALCDSDLEADEWYWNFEKIHPFGDGNGRSGAILWNGHRWRDAGEVLPLEHPPDYHLGNEWFEGEVLLGW